MPFSSYSEISDVATVHGIRHARREFVEPIAAVLRDYFRSELAFTLAEVPYDRSEWGVGESLIYPLLREVWKPYHQALSFWSHEPLVFDDDLCGIPDYMISRRSRLGPFVPDQPILLVVEAKRDDPVRGWGQCLAAMRAAQRLESAPGRTYFGASTNGRSWEFGRLDDDLFVQDPRSFGLADLDRLAAALHSVILACRDQAAQSLATA